LDNSFKYLISPDLKTLRNFSPKLKIAVLASGEGTNFQELIDLSLTNRFDIDIKILITNKYDAGCITRAKESNIPYKIISSNEFNNKKYFEKEIIDTITKSDVELVVMAGWMKIVSSSFVNTFKDRLINIHPSLLPSYKGNNAIMDALSNGSKITGCSVHYVEAEVDSGSLIMQAALTISDSDNINSISKKLHILEHKILPPSIAYAGDLIRKKIMDND